MVEAEVAAAEDMVMACQTNRVLVWLVQARRQPIVMNKDETSSWKGFFYLVGCAEQPFVPPSHCNIVLNIVKFDEKLFLKAQDLRLRSHGNDNSSKIWMTSQRYETEVSGQFCRIQLRSTSRVPRFKLASRFCRSPSARSNDSSCTTPPAPFYLIPLSGLLARFQWRRRALYLAPLPLFNKLSTMEASSSLPIWLLLCLCLSSRSWWAAGDDPYRFFTWSVTYGDIYPLGVKQQGILIDGQFPGPQIEAVTNDNLIVNVFNNLTEPFLISWNGIQQRKNSWEDGVYGTNCPILPGQNFTYVMQVKDQIGSYFYFPTLDFHKAAGGFGGIRLLSRPLIPVPYPPPAGDFTLLTGDWFKTNHTDLKAIVDSGNNLPFPDGLLINGQGANGYAFTVDQGKTYMFRISNVGLVTSVNIRFQGHTMKLVEVEGSHTVQNTYSSLDIHLGQSCSVLVTADQPAQDYFIVVSTRFTDPILTTTVVLHYSNSVEVPATPLPGGPTVEVDWSLNQARSLRLNLTASGPRPNPQGSYHYGQVNITRTIRLANSAPIINGKQRYAVNSVSFIPADTPLKIADFYNISGVFTLASIPDNPTYAGGYLQTSVMAANFRDYVEIVFENDEDLVQSWHIDGNSFFAVGMDGGRWTSASRDSYNLHDTVSRCTVQVYPRSWTAIYMPLDNVGMWNVRSENWVRQYLGQQFYLRVYSPANSWRDEYPIPKNALLCGLASGRRTRPL